MLKDKRIEKYRYVKTEFADALKCYIALKISKRREMRVLLHTLNQNNQLL